jgi:hypothetical protein
MQRSYPLRWLAFGIGLLAVQCIESISDDCTKTLTCEESDQPTLQPDCVWRYSSGREWAGGPQYDTTTRKWRWPDGKETDTQALTCALTDAGADAGPTGVDCRRGTPCDEPRVCNYSTGACVECLDSSQCSGNVAVGDAGAAIVCDESRQQCVPCLRNEHCTATGSTLVCKVNLDDSTRNQCVQCQADSDCGGATPVCDETSNECTTTCTTTADCGGEKPVCNTEKQVCVECLAASDCTGSDTQCNTTSNQCVECVDDVPCSPAMEVCDTTRSRCVQCSSDNQCTTSSSGPYCELQDNLCVQCLDDLQCAGVATSRCNLSSHTCVGCTAHSQCENGLLCNPTLGGGTCVQCLGEADCAGNPIENACETTSGRCVECLNTSECGSDSLARCQTEAGNSPLTQYSCVGCEENGDCSGKFSNPIRDLCDDGVCVQCETTAECSLDSTKSACRSGTCARCSDDPDCSLVAAGSLRACLPTVGCVECVNNDHCDGNAGGPVCKTQPGGSATVNTCVECQSNSDCTSPTASVCSNNQCVACAADPAPNTDGLDGACSHVRSGATVLGVCDTGTCVQCTGLKRAACGTNVCDSRAKTCTNRPARGAEMCGGCVADDECATTARCVEQAGLGAGPFCAPIQSGGLCPNDGDARGFLRRATIATIDTPSQAVCLPQLASCPAFTNYRDGTSCDNAADDAACGASGSCAEQTSTGDFFCTIPCAAVGDCVRGTCNDDLCTL